MTSRLTVEDGKERVFGILVERVHHAAPILVDLGRHAVILASRAVVAGLHPVARVRAHLRRDCFVQGVDHQTSACLRHSTGFVCESKK